MARARGVAINQRLAPGTMQEGPMEDRAGEEQNLGNENALGRGRLSATEPPQSRMATKPVHHDRGRAPAQAGQVESRTTS